MTTTQILSELKRLGSASIKKVLVKHGAREPFYGVKVEELKKIQKKVKMDYKMSMELFDTGISDAMYLAGLIADPKQMSKADIQHWADKAYWYMLIEYPVAWVAAESPYGMELALEWIESDRETIACAGWATLGAIASTRPDSTLDLPLYTKLIERVGKEIHGAPNRVRYCMNTFVISAGAYITSLTPLVLQTGEKIGKVKVDVGDTACKVPLIRDYIAKIEERGALGKKRGSIRY
jgi:3-methyladenine DNA glycosylase AlkD